MGVEPAQVLKRNGLIRVFAWLGLYIVLAAMALGANPLRGETTGPFDLLASHAGWNPHHEKIDVRNAQRSDIVDGFLPDWLEARRQIRDGNVPLWNPLPAGGRSALLEPSRAELTVGFLLFAAAPDPAFGFYLAVLSCMVIAGWGMHLLVSRHRSECAALFAGISYMLCGFFAAWLFWPHIHSAIWIPWLLLAVDSFVNRGSTRAIIGIAACTALMFLGGFPFVVALGMGAALASALLTTAIHDRKVIIKMTFGTAGAMLLGLGLVAVPLLTLASALSEADLSHRSGGSGLTLASHAKLLLVPWAGEAPQVESNMYVGMLALAFALVGLCLPFRRKADALTWTAIFLLLVGVVLTFGLLPKELGAQLPVLSNNPWSRAILLMDIGIILLAATGLDFLIKSKRHRPWLISAGIIACAIQGIDLGQQFRKFNGATPSRYFYPVSAELAYLKARMKPFQYVEQDHSYFMVSGTLAGIGLGEWYAHALRSSPLQRLLGSMADNPFTTKTATAIPINRFRWQDDLADSVGLCYAVYPSSQLTSPAEIEVKGKNRVALAPINNTPVLQRIDLDRTFKASSVALRLATYQRSGLDGAVTVSLRNADSQMLIAHSTLNAAEVRDNQMAVFRFADPTAVARGKYDLELNYVPGPRNLNLTAWIFDDIPSDLRLGGRTVQGSLEYAFHAPEADALVVLMDQGHVAVAENPGCAEGAYWTSNRERPVVADDAGEAQLVRYLPHDFTVESTARVAGYIVVPMHYQKGWEARIDGRNIPIVVVNHVLPAVAVPAGTSQVRFTYRPAYWRTGMAIMTLSLVILAWLWASTRDSLRSPRKIKPTPQG